MAASSRRPFSSLASVGLSNAPVGEKRGVVLITTERTAYSHRGFSLIQVNVLPVNGEYDGCLEFVGISATGLFLDGYCLAALKGTVYLFMSVNACTSEITILSPDFPKIKTSNDARYQQRLRL